MKPRLLPTIAILLIFATLATAQPTVLDYLARYNCQSTGPDHIMNAIEAPGGRAMVSTNLGLTLIDLDNLPAGGSSTYLDRLTGLNARDLCAGTGGLYYVNLHRQGTSLGAGLAVVRLVGDELQLAATYQQDGLLLEKMCRDDDHLYVAAHAHGLRIYSLADPTAPTLVGSLAEGLTDAFDVAVDNDIAYVADGAGGLKLIDVSDPTAPLLVATEIASGTAEDVVTRNGNVYVALGGAGLGFYPNGDPARRVVVPLNGCAESLCWVGDQLAVGTMSGVEIFDTNGAVPEKVATEITARRGTVARLRICSGVTEATDNRLLCSNWNWLDVYQLTDPSSGNQPDITATEQRIRFAPDGGLQQVTLRNDGAQTLLISQVTTTSGAFHCDYTGGAIAPGENVTCQISYDGSGTNATGTVLFSSNDPDENPLPIQVFGNTPYLDPGEMATDFTLPVLTRNPETGDFDEELFTLSDQQGKVVWFQVFGTW